MSPELMMPPMMMRPIVPQDAAAVAALIRTTFGAISPPLVPPPSAIRETTETVAAQIEAGGGALAEADGRVIAAVLWGERDGGLYVGRLSVDPGFRRAGLARALVLRAEEVARAAGHPMMHVGVRLVLTGNRALFASLGFRETTLNTHDGFDAPTWVVMEKQLG